MYRNASASVVLCTRSNSVPQIKSTDLEPPDPQMRDEHRYLIKSLLHASRLIAAFQSEGEVLRLRDLVERTGMNRMTCFRILYTLHHCGLLEKLAENQYRPRFIIRQKRKFVLGYASQGQNDSFPRDVEASLVRAAEEANFELIVVSNRHDAKTAVRNAERLVRERVDLAIVFQAEEVVAPSVAARFLDAKIPLIAIDIPHPGATYFGADNYRAGLIAGNYLGRWVNKRWNGEADEILMLGIGRAGSLPNARLRGTLDSLSEVVRNAAHIRTVNLDGDGTFGRSYECTRAHLRASTAKRILVGAANDPSAVGAVRAFEECGRQMNCAVIGHNADPEGRAEMRRPQTRLIGSVAFFPETYGPAILRVAIDILSGKQTPPAVFVKHRLITPENVDQIYSNDKLLGIA